MRSGRLLLWFWLSAALVLTALVLFAHPFFAITRESDGRTLVVEGWLHDEGLKEAANRFRVGGYERLITTGTVRPFAYYLFHGDTMLLESDRVMDGKVELSFAGLPSGYLLTDMDDGQVIKLDALPEVADHKLMANGARTIRIIVASDSPPPSGEAVVFIAGLQVNGENAHAPWVHGLIRHADGTSEPLTPTFAHQALQKLAAKGIPEDHITAVPTWSILFSRTLSTAIDVTAYTDAHEIERFDVATLAVHARRTDRMYGIARAQRPGNGIIALYDPWCARWTWWGNYYGWYQMLKELAALPLPWLAE